MGRRLMTKQEILEQIDTWISETKENEEVWGNTELGSFAYQKVYDFIEFNMVGDEDEMV